MDVLVRFAGTEKAQAATVAGRDGFENGDPCRDDGGVRCAAVQQTRNDVGAGDVDRERAGCGGAE